MLGRRYLFLQRKHLLAAPDPVAPPAGFSISVWTQGGPFSSPPGVPLQWRHLVWWCLFRNKSRKLEATVIAEDRSKRAVHVTYVFPRYFRFPFMGTTDLQLGGLWTKRAHRNHGLATAAVAHTLRRLNGEQRVLWYVTRPENPASVALGRRFGFGGSLAGYRKAFLGLPLPGVYRVSTADAEELKPVLRKAGREFVEISETTGTWVTQEGARMAASRYAWAASLSSGRDVLEIGCGSAQGGVLLSRVAKRYVAGDISEELLARISPTVRQVSQLAHFSADRLPFRDASFDLLICLEAIYYVHDIEGLMAEARRVLRPGGQIAIVSANPARRSFIASPHAIRYFTPSELAGSLARYGFSDFRCFGVYPVEAERSQARFEQAIEVGRTIANHLRLVPRTLEGRARLKALVYRQMQRLPEYFTEESGRISPIEERPINATWEGYKVFYFSGWRSDS